MIGVGKKKSNSINSGKPPTAQLGRDLGRERESKSKVKKSLALILLFKSWKKRFVSIFGSNINLEQMASEV